MSRCILVFGMPRSGTAWIGKPFDSPPGAPSKAMP
jgi:hypothetical protein